VEQRAKAVLAISDRTYVLGGGEVRMAGTPAELSVSPEFVESFLGGHGPVTEEPGHGPSGGSRGVAPPGQHGRARPGGSAEG
jgi:hypothetical protein